MEKFENHQHSRNNFFDNLRQRGHSPNPLTGFKTVKVKPAF
jgi:hypothetical protein